MPTNVNYGSITSLEKLLLKYKNLASHPQLTDKLNDYLESIKQFGHTPSEDVIAAILDLVPTTSDALAAHQELIDYMQSSGLTLAFTSDGGGETASLTMDENTHTVTTLEAYDPQGDLVVYTISGGADAALFEIDEVTGELSFIDAPDFEAPGSADADNFYDVTVMAYDTDSGQTDSQAITVEVLDVVEATGPVIYDLSSGTEVTGVTGVAENFVFDMASIGPEFFRKDITNFTIGEDRFVVTNFAPGGAQAINLFPEVGYIWILSSSNLEQSGSTLIVAGDNRGAQFYFRDESGDLVADDFIFAMADRGDFDLFGDWYVPFETMPLDALAPDNLFVIYSDDLIFA